MTLEEFADKTKAAAANTELSARKLVQDVAIKVGKAVVLATPVDTGRARINWQTNLGVPIDGVLYPKPDKPPSPDFALSDALTRCTETALKFVQGEVHITNNVPYIKPLNDGYSSQAPAGFIEKSAQVARLAVQGSRFNPFDLTMSVDWTIR